MVWMTKVSIHLHYIKDRLREKTNSLLTRMLHLFSSNMTCFLSYQWTYS